AAHAEPPREGRIDFDRQVRSILSENCFACHGPDDKARKAKLRLDTRDGAFAKLRHGGFAVGAGALAGSGLIRRITSPNAEARMPPAKSGKELTAAQIDLITQWIEQGAKGSEHWAFVPPKRSASPKLPDAGSVRNGIDYFIRARVDREGLKPSPEADKASLIRRLTLDLTGLPPTPAEVDAFLADTSAS